ncbi:MAG TPA: MgtC/SapB family protein [Atribacteraceae bacterium]|nr:MgtC/SapB family protein [Atribacteraceae bacterium]
MFEILNSDTLVIFIRLISSFIAGGLVGFQRELAGKPAGLRTHVLLCLGSALITTVSIFAFGRLGFDPSRITAQIVSGIGFLGAGTIFRLGPSVTGLTTAASLWVISGIGIAMGSGLIGVGFIGVGLTLLALTTLEYFDERMEKRGLHWIRLTIADRPGVLGEIGRVLGKEKVNIKNVRLEKAGREKMNCSLWIEFPLNSNKEKILFALQEVEGVDSAEIP